MIISRFEILVRLLKEFLTFYNPLKITVHTSLLWIPPAVEVKIVLKTWLVGWIHKDIKHGVVIITFCNYNYCNYFWKSLVLGKCFPIELVWDFLVGYKKILKMEWYLLHFVIIFAQICLGKQETSIKNC